MIKLWKKAMILTRLQIVLAFFALAGTAAAQKAEDYYDAAAMSAARKQLLKENGGQVITFIQADRLENFSHSGKNGMLWEGQGWIGSDYQRLWIKTEGEYLAPRSGGIEDGEVQALYSRAVSPLFDFQAGIRQDLKPGERRTFGVIGFQGLAPYWFEIDTALFVSHEGDVSARAEVEYEFLFTQRLILQPRAEVNVAIQDVPRLGIGRGLSTAELGLRLRYEIKRQFAPYVGVSWLGSSGRTAEFDRMRGRDTSSFTIVGGLRLWF
jgi:copper resistance protein B